MFLGPGPSSAENIEELLRDAPETECFMRFYKSGYGISPHTMLQFQGRL